MNWSIDFAPMLPTPFFWAAGVLAALLIGYLIYRGSRGALLRAAAIAAVLAALANPILREEQRESLANIAIVVVDESASQTLGKRAEQTAAVRENLEAKLGKIPNLEIKWVAASRPDQTTTPGTHLFGDLNKALADTPPDRLAGVIMLTDGQVHDVPKSAEALGFGAPVHALVTGAPDEFDRRIQILSAPRYGIVGQSREIEVVVRESGRKAHAAEPLSLTIRREGREDETVVTTVDRPVKIEMPFPHAGQNILEVDLPTAPGELTPANNRAVVAAEGVRENLRVLLVSGEPHAGERTWRNLLKSDAAVDLVHFTILRPPEKHDGTPINQLSLIAFPTRELFSEKINDFDLIIFDRYQHRGLLQLPYYDNIARYVTEHGGALLVAAGDDYASNLSLFRTPLSPVLPAVPTGRVLQEPFKAKLTEDGRKHPVTQGLTGAGPINGQPSWGRWFRQVEVQPDQGRTLMHGVQKEPLLILDHKGKGRVALLTSDQAWLWARGYDGGGPHSDLLRRLSHWLMKEPDLEEERLIASARGLKLTLERRSMEEKVEPITLSAPGGDTSQVTLQPEGNGVWRATIDVKVPGLYKAQTMGPEGELQAVAHAGIDDPIEMSEVTATDAKLSPINEATGGGAFWTSTSAEATRADPASVAVPRVSMLSGAKVLAGSGWLGLKDREAFVTRGVKLTPMFTGFGALAALLLLISLAWWREGK
ncbi:Threonine dehydrogenase [Hyphomicrobium sulfonivorans]|uniref:Threonine dehydrogenase n=1 Tax=Hyphomicrobium sulfonivorans TaxID=121290 RepID=A0A109B8I9_HYPSL|nr:hypothetical protein [Hyphomicrobium sulfonivorans]KWT64133.1 Threonine dehydrogenase [Hyphomicrobium sulfonivorans]